MKNSTPLNLPRESPYANKFTGPSLPWNLRRDETQNTCEYHFENREPQGAGCHKPRNQEMETRKFEDVRLQHA